VLQKRGREKERVREDGREGKREGLGADGRGRKER